MKDDFIHVRVNSELKQKAQEHARETGRTLAGLIEYLIKKELKEGEKKMRTWYILVYDNGNRAILEEEEYFKEMEEQYGIDPESLIYYGECIAGVIESEKKPTWDEIIYDRHTRQYYHIDDICNTACSWKFGSSECRSEVDCPYCRMVFSEMVK